MTIARRLVILLAVPLVALLGIAVLTRMQLSSIEERSRFVAEGRIPSLAVLGNISRSFAEMRVNVRSHVLATTPAEQEKARAAFQEDEAEVVRLLQHYADHLITGERDRRLFNEFRDVSNEWAAGARQVMALLAEGRQSDAVAMLNGPVLKSGLRASKVSREWIGHNEALAADAGKAALENIEGARRKMLIVDTCVILVTAVLGFLTFQRIARPIRALDRSVRSIAAGDYAQAVPFTAAVDETGGLARSIEVLKQGAAATDEQRWVKSAAARLTGELQGAATLSEFGQRLVSGLVPMLGGGVAAFYACEEDAGRLRRVAAYGLAEGAAGAEDSATADAFAAGDGLVGQAARDRKAVTLANLPPDYLRIRSGLGEAAPTQAAALPLLSSQAVLGVVEVGTFRAFGPREQALLDELLPVAAMSLEILQRNLHTQELLARTREQGERLRETEQFFRGVLELAPDGLLVVSADGTIELANAQCEKLFGHTREELIGQPVEMLVPVDVRARHPALREGFLSSPRPREMGASLELRGLRKDGSLFPVEIGLSPLQARRGEGPQVAVSIRDVTDRKKAAAELQKRAVELQHTNFLSDSALDLTKAGYWQVPLDGSGWYNSSERAARIFGDPPTPDHRYTLEHWAAQVRAGDEAAAKVTAENFAAAVAGTIPVYDATYAYKRPIDGRIVWIHALGHVVKDESGKPKDMFGVTQDITEFKQLEADLRQAMAKAEEATKAKSAFLANMSHEIRTPMNGIIGMTELALDTDLNAEQRDYLNTVKWSADALLTLINDILDFSKIEAGRIELDPIEFLLRDAISDTLNPLALRAGSKGLELAYDIDPDVPDALVADIYRLRQVIVNLVGNAIKFTEKGEVVVSVRVADSSAGDGSAGDERVLEFAVRDTGIGIPPAAAAKLFNPFEQADAATTRKYGGTGLGLAISKQLVEVMGGAIRLDTAPGHGSTFTFTTRVKLGSARPAASAAGAAELLAGKTALIVDDNATNRRILETMLGHWGLRTLSAGSGKEALALLDRSTSAGQTVSLVISDLHMPEMDGFDVVAALRRHSALGLLPVIMLTSSASPGDQQRCDELHVAARLLKPVKQSLLLDNIMRILAGDTRDRAAPAAPVPAPGAGVREPGSDGSEPRQALRVLLAEDNPVNVKFTLKVLERAGHEITHAENGRRAVELWESRPFDVVLMDVQMPEMDGLDATRAIRQLEKDRDARVPIIAMTANAMTGDREICIAAGMDGYVAKPVKKDALFAELERVLARGGERVAHV